jgi:hypothetical protein
MSLLKFLGAYFMVHLLSCENPRHTQHLQRFLKRYPTADKNEEFPILTVNPEDWAIDLEHPEKNNVKYCQMCRIQEDIKNVTSPLPEFSRSGSFN